jgi:deazaflavin-dependent oxidoreductase (nitroreductase family)
MPEHLPRPLIRGLSGFHTLVLRATRGRWGRRIAGNGILLLTTKGRSTGKLHTVPLLYLTDEERYVVIASFGGHHYHPDWWLNLREEPEAEITVDNCRFGVRASMADESERARWWPRAVAAYEGYRRYQDRTDREIPIVFLEPV